METCVINMITQNLYFGFSQTFKPKKCVRDGVDIVSGFKLMEDQEWAKINVKSTRNV